MARPKKIRRPGAENILKFMLEVENGFPYADFDIVKKMEAARNVAVAKRRIEFLMNFPETLEDASKALDALKSCMNDIDEDSQARFRLHWKQALQNVAAIPAGENVKKRDEQEIRRQENELKHEEDKE